MSENIRIILSILVMALTTYLIRCLPMVLFRKRIENRMVRSFLYYVPYAVLAAMTIPAVFSSTSMVISAAAGLCVALAVSCCTGSLITVAMCSCGAVYLVESLIRLIR